MDLLNYYNLLPNFSHIIISSLPAITYFCSAKFYKTFFHQSKKIPDKKYIQNTLNHILSIIPTNIFIAFPLFNYFSDIDTIFFL